MSKVWEAAYKSHNASGVLVVNTFAVKSDEVGPDISEQGAQEVADDISSWLTTLYRACLKSALTVDELAVRELFTTTPATASHSIGLAGTLTGGANDLLPVEMCAVLTRKSAVATRSGRGRMFFPAPATSSFVSGENWVVGNGYLEAITAFGNALNAGHDVTHGLDTYHLSAVIHSRKNGVAYDQTSTTTRQRVHWLRSRSTAP